MRGLPMTAGSDAHHEAAIGTAYTILDTPDFSLRASWPRSLKSNELNQKYMSPKDSLRKTWNNWLRLRRRKRHVPSSRRRAAGNFPAVSNQFPLVSRKVSLTSFWLVSGHLGLKRADNLPPRSEKDVAGPRCRRFAS